MKVEDLERAAAAGSEMPEDLDMPEQLLFLTLRELYSNYRAGAVNKERARREKQRVMVAYNGLTAGQRVVEAHRDIRRRIERHMGSLYRCDCPHCQKLIRLLDGVDRTDIPESVEELHMWNEKLRDLVKERSERAAALRTRLDSIGWVIDGKGSTEEKLERIKELLKNDES